MLLLLFLFLFVNYSISVCPNGTTEVPSSFGGNWRCILFNPTKQQFVMAEVQCTISNGHLISITNGFLDLLVAGQCSVLPLLKISHLFQIKQMELLLLRLPILTYVIG